MYQNLGPSPAKKMGGGKNFGSISDNFPVVAYLRRRVAWRWALSQISS